MKKRELEREVQTLLTFSPSHSWTIIVCSGQDSLIVGFGKLQKLSDTDPHNLDVGKVWSCSAT